MKKPSWRKPQLTDRHRRSFFTQIIASSGLLAVGSTLAAKVEAPEDVNELHFPGDPPTNKVVYQFNKADADYHDQVIFSVGAMLRKYGDDIHLVVTCFGPGVHVLANKPKRPVAKEIQQRIASLDIYGVEFHACGNTLKSLNWTKKDLLPFVKVVEVGAADLLELQQQGYAYISW